LAKYTSFYHFFVLACRLSFRPRMGYAMGNWQEPFNTETIISNIHEFSTFLAGDNIKKQYGASYAYKRLCSAVDYAAKLAPFLQAEFVSFSSLEKLQKAIESLTVLKEVESLDLERVNSIIDEVLDILPRFVGVNIKNEKYLLAKQTNIAVYAEETEKAAAAIENVRKRIIEGEGESSPPLDEINGTLAEIRAARDEIESAKNKIIDGDEQDASYLQIVKENCESIKNYAEQARTYSEEISTAKAQIIDGDDEEPSYLDAVKETCEKIEKILEETKSFYETLAGVPEKGPNYKDAVKNWVESIKQDNASVTESRERIDAYYISLFGKKNEKGENSGGIRDEVAKVKDSFDGVFRDYKKKSDTLFNEIESLLPGATSAGLTDAYKERLEVCQSAKKRYTWAFYISIGVLALLVCFSDSIMSHLWGSQLLLGAGLGQRVLAKLFLVAPLIWIASFTSNRSNEMTRLAEEYGHKKALAQSYYGFKKQVEELQKKDTALAEGLLRAAIESLAYNASNSLEKAKKENHPFFAFLPGFSRKGDNKPDRQE